MDFRRKLLWIDGSAGLAVGVGVLLLSGWLSEWYGLPQKLLIFTGVANLAYGSYSTSLARRAIRPRKLLLFLITANLTWAFVCLILAATYGQDATFLGLGHLLAEALFVGGLACLEWRWRELLMTA